MNHLLESLIAKVKIDPEPRVYFRICEELRKTQDFEQVICFGKQGLERNAQHLPLLLVVGKAYQKQNGWEDAIPYFQRALDLDPGNIRANQGMALSFLRMGFAGEAESFINNLRFLQPQIVEKLETEFKQLVDISKEFSDNEVVEKSNEKELEILSEETSENSRPIQNKDKQEDQRVESPEKLYRLRIYLKKIRSSHHVR